jgi:hypothetical protein
MFKPGSDQERKTHGILSRENDYLLREDWRNRGLIN